MKKIILQVVAILVSTVVWGQNLQTEWLKGVGGNGWDEAKCVTKDASGNIYIAGTFSDSADFDPGPGDYYLSADGYSADIFILKLDRNGGFIWAKAIHGQSSEEVNNIVVTSSYVYVGGSFQGTNVDFDPGTGTHNLSSVGSWDPYLLVLDNSGNFTRVISYGGTSADYLTSFVIDGTDIYITGKFSGTCDFDPGTGTVNKTSNGGSDFYLLKVSNTGTFQWVNTVGGSGNEKVVDVGMSNTGVVISGTFSGTVDFDPGTGVHNKTAAGAGTMSDVFVEKFNSSGNFQWVKSFGAYDDEYLKAMYIDVQGNIYTTGDYFMQVDFDPGNGTYFLTSHPNGNDVWIQKLNPSGNFLWAVSFGNNNYNTSFSITTDDNLNVYTAGAFEGGYIDLNPGADSAIFDNFNDNSGYQTGDDIFIQKLDSTGAFVTATTVGGKWFDGNPKTVLDDSLNIILLGNFESDTLYSDFSYQNYLKNHGNGGNDIFILKLSQFGELFTPSATNLTSPPFDVSFTVNIDDTTNLKWFWSFDDGNFSNLRQPTHTYAYNGTYTVSLLVEDTVTGITDTAYHQIVCSGGAANPCNFQAALNQTGAAIICASDSFMLSVQQQSGATYSWFYNGITILGAHSPVYYGKQQGFYMAVVTKNGCSKTTDYFALANYPVTIPAVTVTGTIANCSNDSVKLSASTNYSAFLWNTGDTAREIYTSVSGRFVVKATDANGCLNTSPETVINASLANIPSICAVSTDGVNPNNIVSWKKEVSQKIQKYNVYKESTIAGVYQLLGSVNYSATPEFRDTVSNVAVRQYRYKITAVDTCGKETPVSLPHTTMHLMVNEAPNHHWNLIWRPYVGFNYTTYNIYRGTDSLNMSKIATISASNTSYTDLTNPTGDIFYQIEVVSTDTCNAKGGTPVSRSNNFNTRNASGLGIKTLKGKEMSVRIYPNPNKGDFYLRIEGENPGKMNISVYNILGKKVYSAKQDIANGKPVRISTGDLPAGVYFIDLSNDSQSVYRSRIIIQR